MILGGSDSPGSPQDNLEIWNPGSKEGCILDKKLLRIGAPICGNLICGGFGEKDMSFSKDKNLQSCLLLDPNTGFIKTDVELKRKRYNHMCWKNKKGVLLIGGVMSVDKGETDGGFKNTELVSLDGSSSEPGFNLQYGLDSGYKGCGVDLEDGRFVIIGQN